MASEIINVVLNLIDNVSRGIDSAAARVDTFADKANKLAGAFAPVSIAAGAALGVSVKLAADFDKAVQGAVRGLDLTGKEVEDFTKSVQQLQKDLNYQFSSTELANIATSAGKLGVAKDDIDDFTKSLAKIAVATDQADKIEELGTNAAKIQTVFKLSVADLDSYLNAVNRLDDATSATSNQILNFTQRVSGMAATAKVSANVVAAFGATLISAGKAPETAATFMEKYLSVLGSATNLSADAQKALSKLGYSATDLSQRFDKDATGTMQQFLDKVKELDSVSQREVLGKIFGQEHVGSALLLVNQTKELSKYIKDSGDAAGNAAKAQNEFNKASQSFSGLSATFKNQLQEVGVQLGLVILPTIVKLLGVLSPLLQNLVQITQQHPNIAALIVTLLGVAAVIAPILALVGAISSGISAISALTGVFGGLAVAVSGSLIPLAPFIAGATAVAGIALLIWKNWAPIKGFFVKLWNDSLAATQKFVTWVKADPINAAATFARWFSPIPTFLGHAIFEGSKKVIQFVRWLTGIGGNLLEAGKNWGAGLMRGFINGLQSMYANVQSAMNNFTSWLAQYLPHSDAKKGALSNLTASGQSFADTFMAGIQNSGLDSAINGFIQPPRIGGVNGGFAAPASTSASNLNYQPVYNISAKDADDILKQIKARDRELLDLINRSTQRNMRGAY